MSDLLGSIKEFVAMQRGESTSSLSESTTLQNDLGIWGDDAVELLETYGEKFNVDLSEFDVNKYFKPEGDTILPSIIRFFTGKNLLNIYR